MVMRWMPADERYHVMQASLNSMSSLFGPSFVHFNAVDGEATGTFRPTWYCLTMMTPTRRDRVSDPNTDPNGDPDGAPMPEGSRVPRATLRVALVNETELRRVADGKLIPPAWGFFNSRHEERYRMLVDFATNFQMQLVKAAPSGRSVDSSSPLEKVHGRKPRPDGGLMKRVRSVPDMELGNLQAHSYGSTSTNLGSMGMSSTDLRQLSRGGGAGPPQPEEPSEESGAAEENCFLRLHVPLLAPPAAPHGARRDTHEDRGDGGSVLGPSSRESPRTLGERPRAAQPR